MTSIRFLFRFSQSFLFCLFCAFYYTLSFLKGKNFLHMLMQVLFPGSKSAPDVPLRFIQIQNLSCLPCKRWVDLEKTLGDVFMYRTLTNPKRRRRLPHRRLIFNDIISNLNRSLFNIIFHKNPCIVCFLQSMQGFGDVCLPVALL